MQAEGSLCFYIKVCLVFSIMIYLCKYLFISVFI